MNKFKPHVLVLPEDDADRQIAVGFGVEIGGLRQFRVLRRADGWRAVLDLFRSVYIAEMDRYPKSIMILLIDFDEDPDRRRQAEAVIPAHLRDRVFVLGAWSNPEKLGVGLKEKLGEELAKNCRDGTSKTWDHDLLKHNGAEVERLRQFVRPILF